MLEQKGSDFLKKILSCPNLIWYGSLLKSLIQVFTTLSWRGLHCTITLVDFFSFIVIINVTFFSSDSVLLTWQSLKFRSYGGPTHRNVTSPRTVRWRHVTTVHAESHSRAPRPIQITRPFKPVLSFQRCLVNSLLQSARLKLLVFLMLTYHLSYV